MTEFFCVNCKCKLSETKNTTLCPNCQVIILPFFKFINQEKSKENFSAIRIYEKNIERLITKNITEAGLKHIYNYCKYLDEKKQQKISFDDKISDPIKSEILNVKPSYKKRISFIKLLLISLTVIILSTMSILVWQGVVAEDIKKLYLNEQYYDASNKADFLFIIYDTNIKIIKNKLFALSSASQNLKYAEDFGYTSENYSQIWYESYLIDTIEKCIGWSEYAESLMCGRELEKIKIKAIQMLVKEGYSGENIRDALIQGKKENKLTFLPLRDENIVLKLINQIPLLYVSSSEVEKVNNEKNPIRIENTSFTTKGDYTYYIGTIKNYSVNNTYKFVEIRVTYMDSNKNVLTVDSTYAVGSEGIRPNESIQFKVMTEVRGNVEYGDIEIFKYDLF